MSELVKSYQICWKVGIRARQEGVLLSNPAFQIIKNPWYGWAADPFLFEKDGTTYIFAEVWNYFTQKGSIAYCTYKNGSITQWKKVISEWYHMSYPFIWEDDRGIHICAETNEAKKIYCYTAKCFPEKWIKEKSILEEGRYADSTILFQDDKPAYMFTYATDGENKGKLCRIKLKSDMSVDGKIDIITSNQEIARPGGGFLEEGGILYRVAQNCSTSYGESLFFCRVLDTDGDYVEEKSFERRYEDVSKGVNEACIGMHTYNRSKHFEVIDFRIMHFNIFDYVFSRLMVLRNFIGRNVLKTIMIILKILKIK